MAKKKQPSMFPGSDRKPSNSQKKRAKSASDKASRGNRPKSGITTGVRPIRPSNRRKNGGNEY